MRIIALCLILVFSTVTSVFALPKSVSGSRLKSHTKEHSNELPNFVDCGAAGVLLLDTISFKKAFGDLNQDWSGHMPYGVLTVKNPKFKEAINFIIHPGGAGNEFDEIEVTKLNVVSDAYRMRKSSNQLGTYSKDLPQLTSAKGIRLGQTEEQILKILGPPLKREVMKGGTKVIYKLEIDLEDEHVNEWFKSINMPEYFGEYEFVKGFLVRFHFGFSYP